MIKSLHIGDTFENSVGTILTVKKVGLYYIEVSSVNYHKNYELLIERVLDNLNNGFYKPIELLNQLKSEKIDLDETFTSNHPFPNFYILNKKEYFIVAKDDSSYNQCYKEEHVNYMYEVKLILTNELDNDGFLVDHVLIENLISRNPIVGSCEEMTNTIQKRLLTDISIENLTIAMKVTVKPVDSIYFKPLGSAFMEKVYLNPEVKNVHNFLPQL